MNTSFHGPQRLLLQGSLTRRLKSKANPDGFTLVELMVVIIIVGILTSVGLLKLLEAQDVAKNMAARSLVVNESKGCSIAVLNGTESDWSGANAPNGVTYTAPTCSDSAEFEAEGPDTTYTVTLDGGLPTLPVETTSS